MTKRTLSACLAFVLLLGTLAGCSKNKTKTDNSGQNTQQETIPELASQYAYQPQYFDLPEDIQWIGTSCVTGDTLYFTASVPDGGKETYTDETGAEVSYDTYSEVIFRFDLDTGECVQLDNYVAEPVVENPDMPDGVTMNPDGSMQTFPAFEGKDLDGNDVKSSELFSGNAVTVVNFWFTTCSPCVSELDELEALNGELAEKGGELIGINSFTLDGGEKEVAEAKDVLSKAGATYRNVYFASDGEAGRLTTSVYAYPTTYVVDRNGNIVGQPIVGAITSKKQLASLWELINEVIEKDAGM